MVRIFIVSFGVLTLAAAFAITVVDGTQSIAANEVIFTPLATLLKSQTPALESALERNIHPLLWNPIALSLLKLPAALVLAIAGLLVLQLVRRKDRRRQNLLVRR